MVNRIRYAGRRDDGQMMFITLDARDAIKKGKEFESNGYQMHLSEIDELCYHMHKHCPHLDVKMNNDHKFTIKELYHLCPAMLLDLLDLNGGVDYIAQILIGYEELYKQEQIVREWRENQK